MLRYISRYTHRMAISNHRITAFDGSTSASSGAIMPTAQSRDNLSPITPLSQVLPKLVMTQQCNRFHCCLSRAHCSRTTSAAPDALSNNGRCRKSHKRR